MDRAARGLPARLARRPLLRAALALLVLLYSLAVYAPLLAGDLPLYLRARDRGAHQSARVELAPIAAELGRAWRERDAGRAAAELAALDLRLELLERGLAPGPARDLAREARASVAGLGAGASAAARAELPGLLEELARASDLAGPEPARLRARTSWPALAALSLPERLTMVAWTLLLAALGCGAFALRRARRLLLCGALLGGLLALGLWTLGLLGLVQAASPRGGTSLKQRLHAGDVEVERAVLPPLFFGVAETHTSEGFRPPTWLASAWRDESGRGRRSAQEQDDPALSGLVRAATPIEVRFGEPARNARLRHPAGTDALGRDLAVRLIWGARVSLVVGLAAACLLTVLGVVLGGLAGFLGGRTDFVVARAIELVLAFPALFLIILAAAFTDPDRVPPLAAIVGIIALISWTGVARLVRAEMLRLRESPFVLAARAQGLPPWRVALVHALPNALSPVLVAATFAVGASILTESVVSYLGFGVRHPWPSWGALIGESQSAQHWWCQVFAGLLIFATVSAFNLVGEALRDALDPRLEEPA